MNKPTPSATTNPTPEQMNEPGYTTKYTEEGKWWTLNGIDWYPLKETYHRTTTKTDIEKILDNFGTEAIVSYRKDGSGEPAYIKARAEALAAIDNYTTQRVIGELENAAARNGAEVTPSKLVAAYLRIRLNQLKGGIDE